MIPHILHHGQVLTVSKGDDGEIDIIFRARDDHSHIETIGLRKEDAGLFAEALLAVRDGRSDRVTIHREGEVV